MEEKNLLNLLQTRAEFSSFMKLFKAAELEALLSDGETRLTLFAPNDQALQLLPDQTLARLLDDKEELGRILRYHIVDGILTAAELTSYSELATLEGDDLTVEKNSSDKILINDAEVLTPDIEASNGIIHEIDRVLVR